MEFETSVSFNVVSSINSSGFVEKKLNEILKLKTKKISNESNKIRPTPMFPNTLEIQITD